MYGHAYQLGDHSQSSGSDDRNSSGGGGSAASAAATPPTTSSIRPASPSLPDGPGPAQKLKSLSISRSTGGAGATFSGGAPAASPSFGMTPVDTRSSSPTGAAMTGVQFGPDGTSSSSDNNPPTRTSSRDSNRKVSSKTPPQHYHPYVVSGTAHSRSLLPQMPLATRTRSPLTMGGLGTGNYSPSSSPAPFSAAGFQTSSLQHSAAPDSASSTPGSLLRPGSLNRPLPPPTVGRPYGPQNTAPAPLWPLSPFNVHADGSQAPSPVLAGTAVASPANHYPELPGASAPGQAASAGPSPPTLSAKSSLMDHSPDGIYNSYAFGAETEWRDGSSGTSSITVRWKDRSDGTPGGGVSNPGNRSSSNLGTEGSGPASGPGPSSGAMFSQLNGFNPAPQVDGTSGPPFQPADSNEASPQEGSGPSFGDGNGHEREFTFTYNYEYDRHAESSRDARAFRPGAATADHHDAPQPNHPLYPQFGGHHSQSQSQAQSQAQQHHENHFSPQPNHFPPPATKAHPTHPLVVQPPEVDGYVPARLRLVPPQLTTGLSTNHAHYSATPSYSPPPEYGPHPHYGSTHPQYPSWPSLPPSGSTFFVPQEMDGGGLGVGSMVGLGVVRPDEYHPWGAPTPPPLAGTEPDGGPARQARRMGSAPSLANTAKNKPKPPRRFPCPDCPEAFTRRNDLVRHRRKHTGEKPFVCEVCQHAFARKDKLLMHMQRTEQCSGRQAARVPQGRNPPPN